MAYSYYMPINVCSYCPYMTSGYRQRNSDMEDEQQDDVKKIGDKEILYDRSQYRLLPLLALPFLFTAAGPPGPFYGPPPFFYNYWYYYYR